MSWQDIAYASGLQKTPDLKLVLADGIEPPATSV